jgi:hypothetical protein
LTTTPPPLPGATSRETLIKRLDDLRVAAGLSGNALAGQMRSPDGRPVVQSRVWKILHYELLPNEHDVTEWTRVTGRPDLAGDLILLLRLARSEQASEHAFRRNGGGAEYQEHLRELEAQATRIGWWEVGVIPGILQTADYARQLLSIPTGPRAWGTDDRQIEAMVDSRLRGQEVLHNPDKRIQVVLGEGALRTLVVTPDVLVGQLRKLLSVMQLRTVELGIIGLGQPVPAFPLTFRVLDDDLIITETIVGEHYYSAAIDPKNVAVFLQAFDDLRAAASHGDEAAAIIEQVIEDLQGE